MYKNLLKISLLTVVATAMVALAPASRADDTNAAAASDQPSMKGKISGMVSSVDTNAMTIAVGNQTYSVSDDSQISRNGKPATITDIVVGDPVKGSYTKDADGKMTLTKAKFGKKMGGKKKKSDDATDTNSVPASAPTQ
jgi:hypothetical protein